MHLSETMVSFRLVHRSIDDNHDGRHPILGLQYHRVPLFWDAELAGWRQWTPVSETAIVALA